LQYALIFRRFIFPNLFSPIARPATHPNNNRGHEVYCVVPTPLFFETSPPDLSYSSQALLSQGPPRISSLGFVPPFTTHPCLVYPPPFDTFFCGAFPPPVRLLPCRDRSSRPSRRVQLFDLDLVLHGCQGLIVFST